MAGAFKLPLDAYILAVPIAYAVVAFVGCAARVPARDPEYVQCSGGEAGGAV